MDEEQKQLIEKAETLRAETQKLEAVYQKKISDLEELKKSILQIAFAGELKTEVKQFAVQVWKNRLTYSYKSITV